MEAVDGQMHHVAHRSSGWYGTGVYCRLLNHRPKPNQMLYRAVFDPSNMIHIASSGAETSQMEAIETLSKAMYAAAFADPQTDPKDSLKKLTKAKQAVARAYKGERMARILDELGDVRPFLREYKEYFRKEGHPYDEGLERNFYPERRKRSPFTYLLMKNGVDGVMFSGDLSHMNNSERQGVVLFDVPRFERHAFDAEDAGKPPSADSHVAAAPPARKRPTPPKSPNETLAEQVDRKSVV